MSDEVEPHTEISNQANLELRKNVRGRERSGLSLREVGVHDAVGPERFRTLTNGDIRREPALKKRLLHDFKLGTPDAAKACLDRIRHAKGYPLSMQIMKHRSAHARSADGKKSALLPKS